jgi:hypothetical protein
MDKTMELLEKLYDEMQNMKVEMQEMKQNMATKEDLKNLATKEDLNLLSEELHHEIQVVQDQVKELNDNLDIMELLTSKNTYEISKLKLVK